MNIRILHLIDGAQRATGLTVIIDVFRAFTVEAYLANNGARRIYPVGDKQIAYDMKKNDPNCIIIGERDGIMLPGFDFGNSPSQIENIDFSGKTVIYTTSAGTQGLTNAENAKEIITGSLVNAKAIARYIKKSGYDDISLVCMGLNAKQPIEEDTLCANYIKSLLEGDTLELATEIEKLKVTSGAKFFDHELQTVFPERDFYLCTQADRFDFVLRLVKSDKELNYVEKIEI